MLELISRSIFYTLTNYVFIGMELSFRAHWGSILFSAAIVWYSVDYWNAIRRLTGKKIAAWVLWCICIAVSTGVAYFAGYMQAAVVPLQK